MHQYYKCNYFDLVDGGYYYFKDYDEGEIYVVVKNDEEETTDDITQYYFLYQMLLPNIKIIPEKPENASEGTMILTNNIEFISNYEEYIITQLDSNEYLCVKQ
jgi:hypothetical protein